MIDLDIKKSALELFVYCIAYQHALALWGLIIAANKYNDNYTFTILPINHSINYRFGQYVILSINTGGFNYGRSFDVMRRVALEKEVSMGAYSSDELNAEVCANFLKSTGYDLNKIVGNFINKNKD